MHALHSQCTYDGFVCRWLRPPRRSQVPSARQPRYPAAMHTQLTSSHRGGSVLATSPNPVHRHQGNSKGTYAECFPSVCADLAKHAETEGTPAAASAATQTGYPRARIHSTICQGSWRGYLICPARHTSSVVAACERNRGLLLSVSGRLELCQVDSTAQHHHGCCDSWNASCACQGAAAASCSSCNKRPNKPSE